MARATFRESIAADLREQARLGMISTKLCNKAIRHIETDTETDWTEDSGMSVEQAADLAAQVARIS